MTSKQTILLAIGGAIFAYWAWQMFATLFLMRRRAEADTGHTFPGPGEALRQWSRFFRSDADRTARRRLLLTTLAMFAWNAVTAILQL
jgi:hypothetical protein